MMTRFRVRLGSPVVRLAVLCFCLQLMHTIQPSLDLSPAHSSGSLRRRPALHWLHWHHCFRPTINKDQRRKQRSDAWLFWASVTGLGAWNWENASAHLLYLTNACFTNERNISQSRPTLLSKCQDLSRCQNDEKRLQILSRRYLFRLDKSTSKLQMNRAQCVQAT